LAFCFVRPGVHFYEVHVLLDTLAVWVAKGMLTPPPSPPPGPPRGYLLGGGAGTGARGVDAGLRSSGQRPQVPALAPPAEPRPPFVPPPVPWVYPLPQVRRCPNPPNSWSSQCIDTTTIGANGGGGGGGGRGTASRFRTTFPGRWTLLRHPRTVVEGPWRMVTLSAACKAIALPLPPGPRASPRPRGAPTARHPVARDSDPQQHLRRATGDGVGIPFKPAQVVSGAYKCFVVIPSHPWRCGSRPGISNAELIFYFWAGTLLPSE